MPERGPPWTVPPRMELCPCKGEAELAGGIVNIHQKALKPGSCRAKAS